MAEKQKPDHSEEERKRKLAQLRELEAQLDQYEKSPKPEGSPAPVQDLQRVQTETTVFKELEQLITDCLQKDQLTAALLNCESILRLGRYLTQHNLQEKYASLYERLLNIRKLRAEALRRERSEIDHALNAVRGIVKIETDVAPQFEVLDLPEILNETPDRLGEMDQIADSVLNLHRVTLTHEIQSTVLARTTSGKAFESTDKAPIHLYSHEGTPQPFTQALHFVAEHNVTNPFSEMIEEAIIEDIIPYNYQITEIEVNDELTSISPEKELRKEGLQLTWKVPPLPPDTPIKFRYHLQPRVSRTVIVPLSRELKIIKTHSTPQQTDREGIFNSHLEFVNIYAQPLNGVVLEDRIPMFYQYSVEEHKSARFQSVKETAPNQVKWRLNGIAGQQIESHEYRLIEPYIFDQMKSATADPEKKK